MKDLLSREEFRQKVFERDNSRCVICNSPATDAHHIIERKLWNNGGYYLDNGASLCDTHHKYAEESIIDPEFIRKRAGIMDIILPNGLDSNTVYDKWGKIKYPRTYHLPWSPGRTKDDRVLQNVDHFVGKKVVVTEKMDGECTTVYSDGVMHARSLDSKSHPSRDWLKAKMPRSIYDLPSGWRVCGENVYAKHSIHYKYLWDYFLVFSIWNDSNVCLSWEDTVEWCRLLGLTHVPILWYGEWSIDVLGSFTDYIKVEGEDDEQEGYVVRLYDSFPFDKFDVSVAKYVRKNHVQTDQHWMHKAIIKNELMPYPVNRCGICRYCGRYYEDLFDDDCPSDDCPSNNGGI